MIDTSRLRIRQPKEAYIFDYEVAAELAEKQRSIFWTAEEINVEGDKQDFLVNLSEAEKHGIVTTLKLFTIYELILGGEVWLGKLFNAFPRPEIQMMCATFGMTELSIHSVFYDQLNKTLMLDTEEFYTSYKNDPILSERINKMHEAIDTDDLLYAIAAFTLMENSILYSNFAFIKHFQSQGKDMLRNVVSGINFSAKDENLHATGGAWLFNETLKEAIEAGEAGEQDIEELESNIYALAQNTYDHECRIIEMLFEKGDMNGITKEDLESFVASRVNLTLGNMNLDPIIPQGPNPIADWFYVGISGTSFHDFFSATGSSYNRNWGENSFEFDGEDFGF